MPESSGSAKEMNVRRPSTCPWPRGGPARPESPASGAKGGPLDVVPPSRGHSRTSWRFTLTRESAGNRRFLARGEEIVCSVDFGADTRFVAQIWPAAVGPERFQTHSPK